MELIGSYIKKDDGTLEKNLLDEAMAEREKINSETKDNNQGEIENVTSES